MKEGYVEKNIDEAISCQESSSCVRIQQIAISTSRSDTWFHRFTRSRALWKRHATSWKSPSSRVAEKKSACCRKVKKDSTVIVCWRIEPSKNNADGSLCHIASKLSIDLVVFKKIFLGWLAHYLAHRYLVLACALCQNIRISHLSFFF